MSWDYRVIGSKWSGRIQFSIHEVYYNKDDCIEVWTENPVGPIGETLEELQKDLLMIADAFSKPVLSWEKLIAASEEGTIDKI